MNNSPLKITLCVGGIVLFALGLYLSALLPFLKSQEYINAQRRLSAVRSVADFEENFDMVFNLFSPIGTEEVTKFLGGSILNIVRSDQAESVDRALVSYIEPHLFKDDVRHLLLGGQLRQRLWEEYKTEQDYESALYYYYEAHKLGTNLPPPLYAMLGIYIAHNDTVNAKRIAAMILERWPNDEKVRAILEK